jgi:sugar phosphate permease
MFYKDPKKCVLLKRFQLLAYSVTFLAYFTSHFSRKVYTFLRSEMLQDNISLQLLGNLDSCFMISYGIGSFISGKLGDKYSPQTIISAGLSGSGICILIFQLALHWNLSERWPFVAPLLFSANWSLHGLFQSTGGPVNTVVMGHWFSSKHRGR